MVTATQTVTRLEILDLVRDALTFAALKVTYDGSLEDDERMREVDRIMRTYRALEAGAAVEPV